MAGELSLKTPLTGLVTLVPTNTATDKTITLPATTGTMVVQDTSNITSVTNLAYTGTLTGGTGIVNIGSGQIYKTSGGNTGLGTSSPDARLTIQSGGDVQLTFKDSGGTTRAYVGTAGAFGTAPTGALRLRSDQGGIVFGNSGTENMRLDTSGNLGLAVTPSAWGGGWKALQITSGGASLWSDGGVRSYLSTNIYFDGANRRYVTNGTAYEYSQTTAGHVWSIAVSGTAGNAISFTQAMTLNSDGTLLVGATSILGAATGRTYLAKGGIGWHSGPNSSGAYVVINQNDLGVFVASGGTSWTANSDERIKDIIEPITDAANKVSSLRAVIGKYKSDEEGTRRSFLIAQDVQAVLPEAVNVQNDEQGTLGLQYTDVIPLLVSAIQELTARLEVLENK